MEDYEMNKNRGFTLVEIMTVVVIIGILVAMAWPSYQKQLMKGRRANAQAYMSALANREQQYLLDARTYGDFPTMSAVLPPPSEITPQFYTFGIALAGPPPSFTITATAVNQQTPDGNLTLDSAGVKTLNGNPGW